MTDQIWNDWIYQIHWNKIEWVNPRIRFEGKNHFSVSSKIFCLEENNINAHWVGHLEIDPWTQ